MIKRIFPAVLSLMAVFIFSACDTAPSEPAQIQTQSPQTQQKPTEMPVQQAELTTSEADMAAYSGAMQLMDETYCDKITDELYKTACKTELADTKNLNEALSAVDATLCDKLSTVDKKEACKITIEVEEKKLQDLAALDIQKETLYEIIETGEIAKCEDLADSSLKASCASEILMRNAVDSKNISICDQGTTTAIQEECRFLAEKMIN